MKYPRYSEDECYLRSLLAERRKCLHFTQGDIECSLGMYKGFANRYECGERLLHFTEVAQLCAILSLDLQQVIARSQRHPFSKEHLEISQRNGCSSMKPLASMTKDKRLILEKNLACLLRQRRRELHLTQAMLADQLEMDKNTVSRYETGQRSLYFWEVVRLCRSLHLDVSTLLQQLHL